MPDICHFARRLIFHAGPYVPPQLLVNRTQELQISKETLLELRGNLLVVGKRRIGKTSLIKKLQDELRKEQVLCVEQNLIAYDQNPSNFLREILLLLCYEIGEKVFHKTASELLYSLISNPKTPKGDEERFYRIYKLARGLSLARTSESSAEARINLPPVGGGAGKGEKFQVQVDIGTLWPSEFISLSQELMNICYRAGYKSIVVIADEANKLAAQTSKDILRSYFEVFSSRQIQFVFVADISLIDYRPIEDIFERTLKLGVFKDISSVHELLGRYFKAQLGLDYRSAFSNDSIERIWELSGGHPYLIQVLCKYALDEACVRRRDIVSGDDVQAGWRRAIEEEPNINEYRE